MYMATTKERRTNARHSISSEVTGQPLSLLGESEASAASEVQGWIQDISKGGFCLVAPQSVGVSEPLRCQIRVADFPVSIPVFVQVRWSQEMQEGLYRIGLRFLC